MNYVRNAWYVAGWTPEIPAGVPTPIIILGERIVLYRSETGRLTGLEDRCVHRLAPLSLGRCEGENLRCMYHGLLFAPDGKVVEIPGQDMIPAQARVKSYPVVERHSWIWVWMGDAALADERLIPPAVGLDEPTWCLGHGQLDYAAEARLINDNLLDFSHLTYVHANSFGASEDWAWVRPKITQLDRGVRMERWITNAPGMKFRTQADEKTDNFTSYDFLIPGVLLMSTGSFAPGTAEACQFGRPDFADAIDGVTFTCQAVTPTTAKTSRYFFSWGPRADMGGEPLRDQLMTLAGVAFQEDKLIIEAQQQVIDDAPDAAIMPTSADKGVTLFNRLVDRLAREESNKRELAA